MRRIKIPLTVMIPSMSIIASKTKGIDRERYVYSLSGFNQVRIQSLIPGTLSPILNL